MDLNNSLKVMFIFLASYFFLFLLSVFNSSTGFSGWNISSDLSRLGFFYILIPIPGFFIMFFLFDWIEEFFETRFTRTFWFPLLIFVLGVVAFYIAVFWYFCNILSLNEGSFCSANGSSQTFGYLSGIADTRNILINFLSKSMPGFLSGFFASLLSTNFIATFLQSAYILFLLSLVFGWAGKMIYLKLQNHSNPQ